MPFPLKYLAKRSVLLVFSLVLVTSFLVSATYPISKIVTFHEQIMSLSKASPVLALHFSLPVLLITQMVSYMAHHDEVRSHLWLYLSRSNTQ